MKRIPLRELLGELVMSTYSGSAIYCCVCEDETAHIQVDDDEYFEFGLQCMKCGTIWEADKNAWEDLRDDERENDDE